MEAVALSEFRQGGTPKACLLFKELANMGGRRGGALSVRNVAVRGRHPGQEFDAENASNQHRRRREKYRAETVHVIAGCRL